jgi:tetratricopeptide (TPR) repeat protein
VALASASLLLAGLLSLALARFITAVAADPYSQVTPQILESAVHYFPDNAPAQARLAARLIEAGWDSSRSYQEVAEKALDHASRAAELSPWNYEHHLLLSAARELKGEAQEAEAALRKAVALAPSNVNVHWQMANLLLRRNKPDEAISELRIVTASDPSRLPAALNLIWQASGANLSAARAAINEDPKSLMTLAEFLAQRERPEAAVALTIELDREKLVAMPEAPRLITSLLSIYKIDLAYTLWLRLVGGDYQATTPLIWNGDFERDVNGAFAQFDWNLRQSKYARIGMAPGDARSGQRSLRITYLGVDTTKLEGEISQLVPVRPGARYRLECYVKTENLITHDAGPQVVVTVPDTKVVVASSTSIPNGSSDWQPLIISFVAPSEARALLVSIQQTPRFSYVEPSKGTIWFDDFSLLEQ